MHMQRKLLVSIRNTLRGLTMVDFLGFIRYELGSFGMANSQKHMNQLVFMIHNHPNKHWDQSAANTY